MITSKQRAFLRGLANDMQATVHIGKNGITDALIKQTEEALSVELIKCSVQQNCDIEVKEACLKLAEATGSDAVQCSGRKFVLYKPAKNPVIKLPKSV